MKTAASFGPVLLALSLARPGACADPTAPPRPTAAPRPTPRLRLDLERHVDDVLVREPELPRFSSSVDVVGRSPQDFLAASFKGLDLECGAAEGGAPTLLEMRAMRPHAGGQGQSANILGLAQLAVSHLTSRSAKERYFLYRVRKPDGVSYLLSEGRMASFYAGGVEYEMVQAFADRESAVRAWRQLERGSSLSADSGNSVPVWSTGNCRPGRH